MQRDAGRQFHRHVQPAGRCRDDLCRALRRQRHDPPVQVGAPDRGAHIGHVARIGRPVLHPEEEVLAIRDAPHPWFVDHGEIRLTLEHLDDVRMPGDDGGAVVVIGRDAAPGLQRIGQEGTLQGEGLALALRRAERRGELRLARLATGQPA